MEAKNGHSVVRLAQGYIYKCIRDQSQAPLLMLKDRDTVEPASNIPRMDSIVQGAWDKLTRNYADKAEPDQKSLYPTTGNFRGGRGRGDAAPLTRL